MSNVAQAMIARGSNYAAKQKRLKDDEEEIAALEAEMLKGAEDENKEETQTPESNGEGPDEPEVQTEGDPEQEETNTEGKTSEEDAEPVSGEEKTFKKRYGDLRRHSQKKEQEFKERIEALEARLENSDSVRAPKSDEDIEEWASKYPDVAAIVETIAEKKASEKFKEANDRLENLDKEKVEISKARAQDTIKKAHSDFDKLRESDAFHDWAEEQPKWIQDALYENEDDAASVIRVIDLYKSDKGMTKPAKKQEEKDAAASVAKGTRKSVDKDGKAEYLSESQVSKMSDKEYEENEERINEAMRSGKFIYDMTQRR